MLACVFSFIAGCDMHIMLCALHVTERYLLQRHIACNMPYPACKMLTSAIWFMQETTDQVGTVSPPVEGTSPSSVPGEDALTQALYGALDNGTYLTRGYDTSVPNLNMANTNNGTQVAVGSPGGALPSTATANTATAGR